MRAGSVLMLVCVASLEGGDAVPAATAWVPAADPSVERAGEWYETSFRYAERGHLATGEAGAALTLTFEGTNVALRLAQHATPPYGQPNLGDLAVSIDADAERIIHPLTEPRETVLARGLPPGPHVLRVEHRPSGNGSGARVEAFGITDGPTGELAFAVTGDANACLVDLRAVVTDAGGAVVDRLVRNWLTGQCRLTGLAPGEGYSLELRAIGWRTAVVEGIAIESGRETVLPPIHLQRDPATVTTGVRFPALGRQVVRRAGESFPARFAGCQAEITGARLERTVGPATISRPLTIEEDAGAAFYYDREVAATIADETPRGLYDLLIGMRVGEYTVELRSPSAVMVVDEYAADPVFVSWGHLDTWGQHQAEYLQRLADMANLLAADMVLNANAANPAYITGALARLQMPHIVTFGNHQFPGHERWYGPPVNAIDLAPDIRVLNFGLPWHEDVAPAEALLSRAPRPRIAVINGFEHNAPVDLLDRHRVALIHDGHGPGERVMPLGATPTLRVGKSNSESFRVIRFEEGRVASCTYLGHETAPIPFARGAQPPLRVSVDPPADGAHAEVAVRVTNDLDEAYPACRVTLVMPAGDYASAGGRVEAAIASDSGEFTVLTVRADAPALSQTVFRVRPAGR